MSTRKNTNLAMNTFRGRPRSSTTFRNSFFVFGYSLSKFKIISMFSFQVSDDTHRIFSFFFSFQPGAWKVISNLNWRGSNLMSYVDKVLRRSTPRGR